MTIDKSKPRGFQKLSLEERRAIASKGGKAAHAAGTAHRWTSDEAREMGQRLRKKKRKGTL